MKRLLPSRHLQAVADITLIAGAIGSLFLVGFSVFYNNSSLFNIFFAGWILTPFFGFHKASKVALRWSVPIKRGTYLLIIFISAASLVAYVNIVRFVKLNPAWVFISVPLISWLLLCSGIWIVSNFAQRKIGQNSPV